MVGSSLVVTVETTVAGARAAAAGLGCPRLPPSWWILTTAWPSITDVEMNAVPLRRPVSTALRNFAVLCGKRSRLAASPSLI